MQISMNINLQLMTKPESANTKSNANKMAYDQNNKQIVSTFSQGGKTQVETLRRPDEIMEQN